MLTFSSEAIGFHVDSMTIVDKFYDQWCYYPWIPQETFLEEPESTCICSLGKNFQQGESILEWNLSNAVLVHVGKQT